MYHKKLGFLSLYDWVGNHGRIPCVGSGENSLTKHINSELEVSRLRDAVYGAASDHVDWGIPDIGPVVSFGQDADNELYMLSAGGGVYRIVRQ